jgi:hypothetical protein
MTVPADYVHVNLCVPRKHPQTHIKLPRAPFCPQRQRPWYKTVYSTEEEAENFTGSLIAYVQETFLLLSSEGEWVWEDWQKWEIYREIWKEGDNLKHLGADRIIKIRRILYEYGVTRSNSLYYQPEVKTVIALQGPWKARKSTELRWRFEEGFSSVDT